MSADAKVWKDGDWWKGLHDGPCPDEALHKQGEYHLSALLEEIESCGGQKLRWEFRQYPDGIGLVGYVA